MLRCGVTGRCDECLFGGGGGVEYKPFDSCGIMFLYVCIGGQVGKYFIWYSTSGREEVSV